MNKKILISLVPIAVVILGIIGFTNEGYGFYEALLGSLKFLKVELDPLPDNTALEIARWLGVFFLFGLVYTAISAAIERGIVFAKSRKTDSVAVHGDSVYARTLMSALGKRGIRSASTLAFYAPVQVISFEDDRDALEFYQKHAEDFKLAKEVHLCLKMSSHISIESDNLYVTNISEIRAIDYWNNYFSHGPEKIALIGSGSQAEALLFWGLATNVYDVDCRNRYYVFGDFGRFINTHEDLNTMLRDFGKDSIEFLEGEWYSRMDIIKSADRIILCGDALSNIGDSMDLRDIGVRCPIHIFAEDVSMSALSVSDAVIVGALSKDNIENVLLMDSVHRAGKRCHASYMYFESHKDTKARAGDLNEYLDSDEFRRSWKKLSAFLKGSNYAVAIHDRIRMELLLKDGIDVKGINVEENEKLYAALPQEEKDRLQETEHIRWCRYHFLNNWHKPDGDIIIDGEKANKDETRRLHDNLVPYSELSEEEKVKDSYFYRTLCLRDKD